MLETICRVSQLVAGHLRPRCANLLRSRLCCIAGKEKSWSISLRRRKRGEPQNPTSSSEITTNSICSHLGKDKLLSLPS